MQNQEWMDRITAEWLEWSWIWNQLTPLSPQGKAHKKNLKPFFKGQEVEWQAEIERTKKLVGLLQQEKRAEMEEAFAKLKDPSFFIQLLQKGEVGAETDWFHLKQFLWEVRKLFRYLGSITSELASSLDKVEQLIQILAADQSSFALGDFSKRLQEYHQEKVRANLALLQITEERKQRLEEELALSFKGTHLFVSLKDQRRVEQCLQHKELMKVRETPFEMVFSLSPSQEEKAFHEQIEEMEGAIAAEEKSCLETLLKAFIPYLQDLEQWNRWVGEWDWRWTKFIWLLNEERSWPVFHPQRIHIQQGRYLPLERRLQKEGKLYTPLSVELEYGLTTLVGSNMGGKSVTLKTMALLVALAHYALPVPARSFCMPLVKRMVAIHGDQENIEEGVSTFGSEMLRLAEYVHGHHQLFLMDELARGTNPQEGEALALALAEHMAREKTQLCVMVTHFSRLSALSEAKHYRVVGLEAEGHMNYVLVENEEQDVPRHALVMAEKLGVPIQIIKRAHDLLEEGESHGAIRSRSAQN